MQLASLFTKIDKLKDLGSQESNFLCVGNFILTQTVCNEWKTPHPCKKADSLNFSVIILGFPEVKLCITQIVISTVSSQLKRTDA